MSNTIDQYKIQEEVKSSFYQTDQNKVCQNLIDQNSQIWNNIKFLILSGFQDNGDGTLSSGTVIMNGEIRYCPNNIPIGTYLKPIDVPVDSRPDSLSNNTFTYTSFQCTSSTEDTGFPLMNNQNVIAFRGSVTGEMFQTKSVISENLSENLVLKNGTNAITQDLQDNSDLVATDEFVKKFIQNINLIPEQNFRVLFDSNIGGNIYKFNIFNGFLIAINNFKLYYTDNGVNFNTSSNFPVIGQNSFNEVYGSIIFDNNIFIYGSGRVCLIKSLDNINFTNISTPSSGLIDGNTDTYLNSIIFKNRLFLIGVNRGSRSGKIISYLDSNNFITIESMSNDILFRCCCEFKNNLYFFGEGVGDYTQKHAVLNSNLTSISIINSNLPLCQIYYCYVYEDSMFVAIRRDNSVNNKKEIYKTTDGINFSKVTIDDNFMEVEPYPSTTGIFNGFNVINNILFFGGIAIFHYDKIKNMFIKTNINNNVTNTAKLLEFETNLCSFNNYPQSAQLPLPTFSVLNNSNDIKTLFLDQNPNNNFKKRQIFDAITYKNNIFVCTNNYIYSL